MALSNQNYVHYKSRLQKKQKIKPTVSPFRIHVCNTVGNNLESQSYGNYSQKYEPITDIVANLHASRKHLIHLISRTIRQMYNIPFLCQAYSIFSKFSLPIFSSLNHFFVAMRWRWSFFSKGCDTDVFGSHITIATRAVIWTFLMLWFSPLLVGFLRF